MYIQQLYTNCLAEAAYYVESDGEAAVVDPLRETEPYLEIARERGARIRYVFETHFHADFVSGHIDLARQAGAPIIFGPGANTAYPVYNAKDGEVFKVGRITLKALHTPGHTPESTCYLLQDETGRPHALFTGDTLFVGDVGRPDLLDGVMSQEELAGLLFDSLRTRIKTLPDDVIVYPAHGPGSACGKSIGKETLSTIGEQKKRNYALQEMTREEFIWKVTEGITPPPAYFYEDARINKAGYLPVEEVVRKNTTPLSSEAVAHAIDEGAIVLDTRNPLDFGTGFIKGAVNIGLGGSYAVWVGTLLDIQRPLVLVAEPGKEEESILRLARVGFENVKGYLDGGFAAWKGAVDIISSSDSVDFDFAHLEQHSVLFDVRRLAEWETGRVTGAQLLTLSEMPANLTGQDKARQYFVYCATGYRSMIACSILRREGFMRVGNLAGGYGGLRKNPQFTQARSSNTTVVPATYYEES